MNEQIKKLSGLDFKSLLVILVLSMTTGTGAGFLGGNKAMEIEVALHEQEIKHLKHRIDLFRDNQQIILLEVTKATTLITELKEDIKRLEVLHRKDHN